MDPHSSGQIRTLNLGGFRLPAVDDGSGVDREQEPPRQLHEWRGSDRRCNREKLRKQSVEYGKGVWIRHKARDLDDAGKAAPGVFEHRLQIRECLAGLRFKGIARNLSRSRVDSGLACGVHEVADADGLRVWTDPGDARTINDFRRQSHVVGLLNVERSQLESIRHQGLEQKRGEPLNDSAICL